MSGQRRRTNITVPTVGFATTAMGIYIALVRVTLFYIEVYLTNRRASSNQYRRTRSMDLRHPLLLLLLLLLL